MAAKHVMPHLGISHELDVGAKRLVDGVTDPTLSSGVFYASAAGKLKGPLVDQAEIFPDFANPSFRTTPTRPSTASSPKRQSRTLRRLVSRDTMKLRTANACQLDCSCRIISHKVGGLRGPHSGTQPVRAVSRSLQQWVSTFRLSVHEVFESTVPNKLAEPMLDPAMDLDQPQSAAFGGQLRHDGVSNELMLPPPKSGATRLSDDLNASRRSN